MGNEQLINITATKKEWEAASQAHKYFGNLKEKWQIEIDSRTIQLQILQEYLDMKRQIQRFPGISTRNAILQTSQQFESYYLQLVQVHGQHLADEIIAHIAICESIRPLHRSILSVICDALK